MTVSPGDLHGEAPGRRRPSASRAAISAAVTVAAAAHHRGALVGAGGGALGLELLVGLVGRVDRAGGLQRLDGRVVDRAALALALGPLVPVEAQPGEAAEDLRLALGRRALAVGVLEPEHEGAAGVAGDQPVEEGGARAADVEAAGGAGREAHARRAGHLGSGVSRHAGRISDVRFGAHVSSSGGISKAIGRGAELGCESLQVFTHNPRTWKPINHSDEEIAAFRAQAAERGMGPLVSHGLYLMNLGAPDREVPTGPPGKPAVGTRNIYRSSIESLVQHLAIGDALGLEGVVLHVGLVQGIDRGRGHRAHRRGHRRGIRRRPAAHAASSWRTPQAPATPSAAPSPSCARSPTPWAGPSASASASTPSTCSPPATRCTSPAASTA